VILCSAGHALDPATLREWPQWKKKAAAVAD
jgi:hypothetical protein